MKYVLCSNGSWIDGNIWSLNRSWYYDTYFSLYRAIHPGERSGGMSGYHPSIFPTIEEKNIA